MKKLPDNRLQSNKLSSLQALRAFAASAVVFFHAVEASVRGQSPNSAETILREIAWLGSFGVDVFFVISGFIMMYAHYDDFGKSRSSSRFLLKRLIRIIPNYWLLTALAATILIVAPQLSHFGREVDVQWVVASFLFVPWTSSSGSPWPVLGLGWTLNFEMYFYLVFAIALLMTRRTAILAVCIFFGLSIALGFFIDRDNAFIAQATNWLLAEFVLGLFLGMLFLKGREIPDIFGALAIILCFTLLFLSLFLKENNAFQPMLRFVFFGIPAACLVAALTLTPFSKKFVPPRSVMLIGDASYSLYLTHVFTLPAVLLVLGGLPVSIQLWGTITVLLITSILVCLAFYFLFEKPSQRFLKSWLSDGFRGEKP